MRVRYLGFHMLAFVLVGSAVALGMWQYDSWQARRSAEAEDLTQRAPISLASAIGPDDAFPGNLVGQPVSVQGTWVPSGTIFVSGREQDGKEGFWVVTPLEIDGGSAALEVVRGWTNTLADVPSAPTGPAEFIARLQPPEGTGEIDPNPNDKVLVQLRIADAIQHVDQDLYGAYGVLNAKLSPATDGLVLADLEQLPNASRFTALRNFLYAIEWWAFGLFAAFIWWRWLRADVLAGLPQDPARLET
jgi:surfeit locus 1 family protein